jgi:hypothetical protein
VIPAFGRLRQEELHSKTLPQKESENENQEKQELEKTALTEMGHAA